MAAGITLTMEMTKETKGTVVYSEPEAQAGETAIRTLYIQKRDARELGGGSFPQKIDVTVVASS